MFLAGNSNGLFPYIMRHCFEEPEIIDCTANTQQTIQRSFLHDTILLLYYFFGLQVSFLTWGVLQEKVMTQEYSNANGDVGRFRDSQFLVFVNRILAFCISAMVVLCTRQNRHKCSLYKYIFCSFSNIMSSWCQYEALKYVSFPHQVIKRQESIYCFLTFNFRFWLKLLRQSLLWQWVKLFQEQNTRTMSTLLLSFCR